MATSSRLFIGNLNYKTNAETIGHLFETIGGVDNVKTSSKNGKSLGYGFIEMADVEQAQKAQFQLNRYILDGRQIRVEFAKERKMKKFQNSSKLNKINRSYDNMHIEKNEKDPNWDNQTRIPDQIMKIMKERINPLIHLNCPPDINCSQYFNVPQSSTIIELKSAVIQSLNEVSWINQGFKEILVNDYNIIPHLIPPLIYNNNKCQEVINTPKVLHSLTTLSIYKIGTHFNQENDQQTFALRSGNIGCLWYIQFFADASVQSELVNANYTGVLVITVSTASGHGEEYDNEIYWGLDQISNFLRCLNKWKYYNATFPPQPLLARRADEQIEEEGGNEEIDSQQKNKAFSCNIKDNANRAKGSIFNYFIEQVNTRLSWY
ncbi:MAG: hypothetical protein EZS28_013480 [Streblomastix strix]|uniref:RRM domain-containing protein n=2 Tax=Streblomastix strix TaxID=222440 RepID=A0A5J4W8P5_9EUKA|nr:MAG: hypothetical protein EZS28_013480 [Streblomastix strix]